MPSSLSVDENHPAVVQDLYPLPSSLGQSSPFGIAEHFLTSYLSTLAFPQR